ncbi:hypothetical protein JCGZ_09430 [Jatropha curcas]|uniref:Uncharacterized protein n=1 Tax=Jatropha curcas TaxID=180498 RepID=A0A067KGD4_JATCU|nr:hypothetical protein JCGZ_09430 [Jatropha curcas]
MDGGSGQVLGKSFQQGKCKDADMQDMEDIRIPSSVSHDSRRDSSPTVSRAMDSQLSLDQTNRVRAKPIKAPRPNISNGKEKEHERGITQWIDVQATTALEPAFDNKPIQNTNWINVPIPLNHNLSAVAIKDSLAYSLQVMAQGNSQELPLDLPLLSQRFNFNKRPLDPKKGTRMKRKRPMFKCKPPLPTLADFVPLGDAMKKISENLYVAGREGEGSIDDTIEEFDEGAED